MNTYQAAVTITSRVDDNLAEGRIDPVQAYARLMGAWQMALLIEGTGSQAGQFLDGAMSRLDLLSAPAASGVAS